MSRVSSKIRKDRMTGSPIRGIEPQERRQQPMRDLDAKRDSWKLITSGALAHDTHGEVIVEEATKGRRNEGPGQRPQAATLARP